MRKVKIVEVGPRDGLQNEKKIVPTEVKKEFVLKLIAAGLRTIEVTSFVRPDKIAQMQDSKELYTLLKDQKISMPCLVPNLKGMEIASSLGVKDIALFTATSNTFNKKNINATVDESFIRLSEIVKYTKDNSLDVRIRGYVSTAFGCPYEGEQKVDDALKVIERLFKLGVDEVSVGDTIGVANPYQVKNMILDLKKNFDLNKIAMHFHDTEGCALVNIFTSFEEGINTFDSSTAGLGGCPYAKGATGNVATDDVVNLFTKLGIYTGVDQDKLHEASSFILDYLEMSAPSKFFNAYKGRES